MYKTLCRPICVSTDKCLTPTGAMSSRKSPGFEAQL